MKDYPYNIYPDVMRLRKENLSEEERQRIMRKVAVNIGDLPSLRILLGIDPEEYVSFYPDMTTHTPDTFDTIDTFIEKFGTKETSPAVAAIEESRPKPPQGRTLMEKADFLIRNRRYAEALEIITSLSLNNPEKSIYFAHQIRFLRKLILNEEAKNKKLN